MACAVLNCLNATAHTMNVMPPDRVRIDVRLCDEHDQAIKGGEHWLYDDEARSVVMGNDLERLGMKGFAKFVQTDEVLGMKDGEVFLVMEMKDGSLDRRLWTHRALRELHQHLEMYPDLRGM